MGDERTDTCTSTVASPEAAVSVAPTGSSDSSIIFNTKRFDSWEVALTAVRSLVKKSRDDQATLWYRTNIVHEVDGSFSLQCASCNKEFSLKNPSNFWQTHKKACFVAERGSELKRGECCFVEASIAKLEDVCEAIYCHHRVAEEVKRSKGSALTISTLQQQKQPGIASFTLSKAQIEKATTCIVKAIVTGNVAFSFVENPHLMEAMTTLGMPTITRRQLADRWIPRLADEATVATADILAQAPLVDASSDGWRKKYCEQGAALNNIVALLPDRAYFHDAVNCSSMRKDAEGVKNFLTNSAECLVGSTDADLERLVGWVVDNTKRIGGPY
jgi:hypothetical protein